MGILTDAQTLVTYVDNLKAAGASIAVTNTTKDLPASAGIFCDQYEEWQPGIEYKYKQPIRYQGMAYQVQQKHASQAHQPPDSEGMLAIYTPYPAPDRNMVYPYTYGMSVEIGMKELDPNGKTYTAIQGMAAQLNPPSELPAIFKEAAQ